MKTGLHQTLRGIVFAFLLITVHSAFAFYDPTLGRWARRDPIGERGGPNLFGFVGNEPPGAIDPNGLFLRSIYAINCLGYASGEGDYIEPDRKGESLKEVAEKLGFKCNGPTKDECKADCDQQVMVVYIYSYMDNPDKKDPWADPWIYSKGNDFHAIRGQCGQWSYVGALYPKETPGAKPQPTPDPSNPDSYYKEKDQIPTQRYCCKKKK
jgi:uncharacterized protein RhaS with RHS repeats